MDEDFLFNNGFGFSDSGDTEHEGDINDANIDQKGIKEGIKDSKKEGAHIIDATLEVSNVLGSEYDEGSSMPEYVTHDDVPEYENRPQSIYPDDNILPSIPLPNAANTDSTLSDHLIQDSTEAVPLGSSDEVVLETIKSQNVVVIRPERRVTIQLPEEEYNKRRLQRGIRSRQGGPSHSLSMSVTVNKGKGRYWISRVKYVMKSCNRWFWMVTSIFQRDIDLIVFGISLTTAFIMIYSGIYILIYLAMAKLDESPVSVEL